MQACNKLIDLPTEVRTVDGLDLFPAAPHQPYKGENEYPVGNR